MRDTQMPKRSLFRAKRAPKARPKKPMAPAVKTPSYPRVEDIYPHLEIQPPGPARPMPPVTKWPADE